MDTTKQFQDLMAHIASEIERITGKGLRFDLDVHGAPNEQINEVLGYNKMKQGDNICMIYSESYLPFPIEPKQMAVYDDRNDDDCPHTYFHRDNKNNRICDRCGVIVF